MQTVLKSKSCKRGHPRNEKNLYIHPKNGRVDCRPCRAMTAKRFWEGRNHYPRNAFYRDNYLFGGNRERAIQRDGEKCVMCGMTRAEHKERFNRDITVDHIDGRGSKKPKHLKNNALDNLQTLCQFCHGKEESYRRVLRPVKVREQSVNGSEIEDKLDEQLWLLQQRTLLTGYDPNHRSQQVNREVTRQIILTLKESKEA